MRYYPGYLFEVNLLQGPLFFQSFGLPKSIDSLSSIRLKYYNNKFDIRIPSLCMIKMRRRAQVDKTIAIGASDRNNCSPKPVKRSKKTARPIDKATALYILIASRLASAAFNIIHDCDEVYNYWEPLHYVQYQTGFQTWEYSSKYALRPWIYIILHLIVGEPFRLLFPHNKLAAFYGIRSLLGIASALSDWWLFTAVAMRFRPRVANTFLLALTVSSGIFTASTALLPSSFSMNALTVATAAILKRRPRILIAAAFMGVFWGWSVSGLAFLPYAPYVIASLSTWHWMVSGAVILISTVLPLVLVDKYFYGHWTISFLNFIKYNVIGGGESSLYGVEGTTYYLRNGFNNLQVILPFALIAPPVVTLLAVAIKRKRMDALRLLWWLSPAYVWLGTISLLPHKEERFLYVVYPLLCLAGAVGVESTVDFVRHLSSALFNNRARAEGLLASVTRKVVLSLMLSMALSRTLALILYYGAPFDVFKHLTRMGNNDKATICIGAEWYRFPSSYFLPPNYTLQFVKSGFKTLPRPFDIDKGGSRAAPIELNDKHEVDPSSFWQSAVDCDYFVTLKEGEEYVDKELLSDAEDWNVEYSTQFVVNIQSRSVFRAFYVPWIAWKRCFLGEYVLLRKRNSSRS